MKKNMIRKIAMVLIAVMALTMVGCGSSATKQEEKTEESAAGVTVDYGTSELYTKEDMDAAIKAIEDEIGTWEGVELHNIRFTDDQTCKDNVSYVNELGNGETFDECIVFLTDFHSPVDPPQPTAWEADTEYTDYQWYLGRAKGGDWKILTMGY